MADRKTRAKLASAAARLNARSHFAGLLPPLVLMTDDERLPDPAAAARALPRGSLVILRARNDARRTALAEDLGRIARTRDLFLLIANDPALAARAGADGLHLPEARAGEAAHWRALHPSWLITCAAHSAQAMRRARNARADAVLLSPVFATKSHRGAKVLGATRLRMLTQDAGLPVYALGGIDVRTALMLGGANVAGIAAIGALST